MGGYNGKKPDPYLQPKGPGLRKTISALKENPMFMLTALLNTLVLHIVLVLVLVLLVGKQDSVFGHAVNRKVSAGYCRVQAAKRC